MLIGVVIRRLLREWQRMGVLLLAISLVAAFLALAPLYIRAIAGAELNLRLEAIPAERSRVEFLNERPISDEMANVVADELGDRVTSDIHIYNTSLLEVENDLLLVQAAAYREFDSLFTLVDGRLPDPTAEAVEVVLTTATLAGINTLNDDPIYTDFAIGDEVSIGGETGGVVRMQIVGTVEPTIPQDDPFWTVNERGQVFGNPRLIPRGFALVDAWAFAAITTEAIYEEKIAPAMQNLYRWRFDFDKSAITYDTINDVGARIDTVSAELRTLHPESEIRSVLFNLVDEFRIVVQDVTRPVLLLSLLALSLMLYNLVSTISMILEQQSQEWATIASRGGSNRQLLTIHFSSMAVLCLLAALIGPFIAQGILLVLSVVGPQAGVLETEQSLGITTDAFLLSGAAAVLALIVLTLPAYSLLRTSLLELKRGSSRPPAAPAWARFFLDILLLIIGAGFMLRLYTLVTDVDDPINTLISDPGALVDALSQQGAAGLDDPFSLLGPALLLTGAALLWIRVFPWLMRLFGLLLGGINDLTTRLAMWNVERNPNHYAQLVLLIIGTLALGTASLALIETRDSGALTVAQQETGGDARLLLDPTADTDPGTVTAIDGVRQATPIINVDFPNAVPGETTALLGIPVADYAAANPALAASLQPLLDAGPLPERGQTLPADIERVAVDAFTESIEISDRVMAEITLLMLNADEVTIPVPLTPERDPVTDDWVTHSGALPAEGGPWRFTGFQLDHSLDEEGELAIEAFIATTYLDNLRGVDATGETVAIHDFESEDRDDWAWSSRYQLIQSFLTPSPDVFTEGAFSLRFTYEEFPGSSQLALIEYRLGERAPIPAVVTRAWASSFGQRRGAVLEVGDTVTTQLNISVTESRSINYVIVGFIADLPTLPADALALVTETRWLQRQLNANTSAVTRFDINEMWLDLASPEPTATQRETLAALPGYADAIFAWTRFEAIQRDPLANTLTGMLFAGFWVSLGLILLDFAFYMAVTTERRSLSMAVLRSMGWDRSNIWRMLTVEQAAFITPALIVGFLLGGFIAYLILPFLGLVGDATLQIPLGQVLVLLAALILTFTVLLVITAINLQRMDVNTALRQQE